MNALLSALLLTSEVIVVDYRRGIIGWILIGLLAGWLAGKIARGRGFGCIGDIILGLIGSLLGGWIFGLLGIWHGNGGVIGSIIVAFIGAVILVWITRLIKRA